MSRIKPLLNFKTELRQPRDIAKFKETLKAASNVVIFSGTGTSAESGIPTYRSDSEYWRKYHPSSLARREVAAKAQPNAVYYEFSWLLFRGYYDFCGPTIDEIRRKGHIAIANFESKHGATKAITVITQNVDGLHVRAGTKNLVELHGSLFKTRCTKCKEVLVNNDSPICEALVNHGAPDENIVVSDIPVNSLPHCLKSNCGGLLRPHILWFGEHMDCQVQRAKSLISRCDVLILVGTPVVYPAAMFATQKGAIVAEFNIAPTPATSDLHYYFEGPCGTTLPEALDV